jgi:Tol biopolymer transport system component
MQQLDSGSTHEIASSKNQVDYLAWSPDSESVIFSSSIDGTYQISEAGPGRDSVLLSNGNDGFFVQDVSFDGSKILYGSASETSDLWTTSVEEPKPSIIANDVAAEFWADISPDGKSVAFQSVRQTDRPFSGSVWVRPANGSPVTVSPSGFSPVWSNNGQWIAFFKRTEAGIEIWRVRPTGDEALKLAGGSIGGPDYTATPYFKVGTSHLSWSPDDTSVAYSASLDGVSNIWLAGLDGTHLATLTKNEERTDSYCCPIWSPAGKSVIFTSLATKEMSPRQATYRIWIHQLESSERRMLFESKVPFRLVGLSRDGTNAIITERADPADLTATPKSTNVYSLSLQTGAKSKVNALENAYIHNVHLSRDREHIAFTSRKDGITTLWTVPVNGGTPKQLFVENDPKVLISSLTWSPDGRSIAFGKQTRTHLLSMLTK